MSHIHNIVDTDIHYKIDGVSRTITNVNETKRELVQGDHNSEIFTFEVPRFIDGHDISECNVVQVHYINLDKFEKYESIGVYNVDDLHIKEGDANTVILSWLISGNATRYVGTLNFSIRFACVNDGVPEYVWNTTTFKGISILTTVFNSGEIANQIVDSWEEVKRELIAEILQRLSEEGK